MWSSTSCRGLSLSSSSSKSSSSTSSSSSPSPFSPSNPRLKTMEEVWKDINLSSLQDHTTTYSRDHDPHQTTYFGGMILQDFLARPFPTDTQPPPPPPASPVPATTMLNLNSVPELHFFSQNSTLRPPTPISQVPVEGLASSAAIGRKRIPEIENNSAGDRRNKRMIKNRESAARSRARKQAYMNELELEVTHLLEENARLKKQQQQLRLEAAAQVPKMKSLYRTSTAPF